jgi:L-ribulokinase
MSNKKYSLGLDYGTQSGRAVLVEVETGIEVAEAVLPYKHGVIDEYLPGTNIKLPQDFALQNPDDYIEVLTTTVPKVMSDTGIYPEDIIGVGIDFTSCTILPVTKEGGALCKLPEYRQNPHSWVKLWKHHAAQPEANEINRIAGERNESFLSRYGGKISSEWLVPKVWQILKEAPEIYSAADSFMEAGDWVTMQLTGVDVRNSCAAGYKALWSKSEGYPNNDFFKALDPRLENLVEEKLNSQILPIGSKAGELCKEMAEKMGLKAGTAVSVANVDAHVAAPAVKVVEPGKMLMIMGTSTCHMLLAEENKLVKGVGGVVEDGIIPGFYGYEAGQAAVGDIFEWFVDNQVPESYRKEAKDRGVNIHTLLEEKASKLKPGESGLIALDWWNGNRSTLVDADLTGMILGATLLTKPEEI